MLCQKSVAQKIANTFNLRIKINAEETCVFDKVFVINTNSALRFFVCIQLKRIANNCTVVFFLGHRRSKEEFVSKFS